MTTEDWPRPTANAVRDLTYSGWSRIRTCVLRAAFSLASDTKRLDRGNDYAAVGNARHKLVELVVSGRRRGWDAPSTAWVKTAFEALLLREHEKLAAEWSPAEVPAVRLWRNVSRTRIALAREFGQTEGVDWPPLGEAPTAATGGRSSQRPWTVPPEPDPGDFLVEVEVRDLERGYWGRLDRLENRSGTLTVVDLKSGVGLAGNELVVRHRKQMFFYAGLVEAAFGSWPRLELVPVSGDPVEVEYTPADVWSVREQAAKDRDKLNAALSDGAVDSATPSVGNCSWCPFQVVCPAFLGAWDGLTSVEDSPPGKSLSLVRGTLTEVRMLHSATDVIVEQPADLTSPAGDVTITRLPAGLGALRR